MTRPGPTRTRGPVRRAGRRKDEVLAAACRVIAERGADATRFADVATSSGVPISTLQYYFGSREDLLVAAFQFASAAEIAQIREALRTIGDPWQRLVTVVDTALAGYPPESTGSGRLWIEAWRFGMRDEEMRADVHRDYAAWRALIAEVIGDGIATRAFRPVQDAARTAVAALALLDGLGVPLAVGDPEVPAPHAREIALTALRELLHAGRVPR